MIIDYRMFYKNDIKMTEDKRFETGDESGQSGQSYVLKTRRPFCVSLRTDLIIITQKIWQVFLLAI